MRGCVVGTRRIDGRVPFTISQYFPGFWNEVDTTSTRVCGWGGVGHVNVPCTLQTLLMFRNCQDVGQGLGWGGACVAKKFEVEAVCHQRKQFTRKTAQKASTRPCLAGTQMIDRAWRSLKFEWLPAHVNATQKKDGHTVLSPIVSELVFQCAWRQHQGPMSPTQFFTALQRLLKH